MRRGTSSVHVSNSRGGVENGLLLGLVLRSHCACVGLVSCAARPVRGRREGMRLMAIAYREG
eukprot:scaffold207_cov409-Prasinococcus_capsulatus_cf.AAC.65